MLNKIFALFLSVTFSGLALAEPFTVPDISINAFGVNIGHPYKDYRYINYPFKTKINFTPTRPRPENFNHYQIVLNRDSTVHSVYAYGDVYTDWAACDDDARKLFLSLREDYKGFVKGSVDMNRYYVIAGNTQDIIIKCNEKDRLYFIAKVKKEIEPEPVSK